MNNWLQRVCWEQDVPTLFVRFYTVGFILFLLPFTREVFVSVTALSLVFVFGLVFWFHTGWNKRTIGWFLFIVLSSFLVEMYGVNTGRLFGKYIYGPGLGWQVYGTPLIIGFNWLFLVYASHDLAGQLFTRGWQRILMGTFFMICYDLFMEWVAPFMNMWTFYTSYAPLSNFIIWMVLSLIYHTGFEWLGIRTNNRPARCLFVIQLVFFQLIGLFKLVSAV